MTIHDNTPILIGCGLTVQKEKNPQNAKAPIDLLVEAGALALADTGDDKAVRAAVDAVGSIRFITDSPEARAIPYGKYPNPAATAARLMGLAPKRTLLAATGGNSPQMMINEMAEQISRGDIGLGLLIGGEGFGSLMRAIGQGLDMSHWNDAPDRAGAYWRGKSRCFAN